MVFITRLVLKNYRSIGACDCSLGPLTFVVGPNGAGKANLLDGLCFVRDAVRDSVRDAVERRGGFPVLRRWSSGRSERIGVQVDFTLRDASGRAQVLVTTHSADLPADAILAVSAEEDTTSVEPLDEAARRAIPARRGCRELSQGGACQPDGAARAVPPAGGAPRPR